MNRSIAASHTDGACSASVPVLNKKRMWRLLIGLSIAAGVMLHLGLTEEFDLESAQVDLPLAGAGLVSTFAIIAVRALRWNMILGGLGSSLPLRRLVSIYGASLFLALVSPARLGELSRAWWSRKFAGGLATATFSVAFDRAFDLVPMLVLVGLMGALTTLPEAEGTVNVIRGVLVALGILVAIAIAWPEWLRRSCEKVGSRLLRRFGEASAAELRQPRKPLSRALILRAVALSILSQVLALLQMWLFARSVGIDLSPVTMYAVISMATLVSALPISVAGIGTREATVLLALAGFGVTLSTATVFSVLWLANFMVMLGVSLLFFVRFREPMKSGDPIENDSAEAR